MRLPHAIVGSRFHRAPACRARPNPLGFEPLEDRSTPTAGLEAAGVQSILWNGAERLAYRDEWILRLDTEGPTPVAELAAARELVDSLGAGLGIEQSLGRDMYLVKAANSLGGAELGGLLGSLAGFRYLEPNFALVGGAAVPNDASFPSQWALNNTGQSGGVIDADIDAPEAWNITTGSSGVVVSVIDTGVNYNHTDLAANMWINPGEIAGDGIDNDSNGYVDDIYGWDFANDDNDPMDDEGHGTACAGIIAAVGNNAQGVVGVNWGAKIMALKYLNTNFIGAVSDAIRAVNYATMMRETYGVNVRATNNSYGIPGYSQAFADAIAASGDAGILFATSAGNSSSNNDLGPQYPANFPLDNILSVAATTRTDDLASFSSYGPTTVHLGAPGSNVLTTALFSGTRSFSGTSAASPYVAGVAALLWSAAPYASVEQIRSAILDGTDPIPALAGLTITGGRLNAMGALEELGFWVRDVSPDDGSIVAAPPTQFTVDFSSPVDLDDLTAAVFEVNGSAADSFSQLDDDTLVFSFTTSPVTAQGVQTMSLAGGSVRSTLGRDLLGFEAHFRYDAAPLAVTFILPASGSLVPLPVTTILVNFSEAVDPDSIDTADIVLSQGVVTGVSLSGDSAVLYSVSGIITEGTVTLYLSSAAVTDIFGNPVTTFTGGFSVDSVERSVNPFVRLEPLGSLIFASLANHGVLQLTDDIDDFLVDVEGGETLVAQLTPADPTAAMTVSIVGGATATGSPGQAVYLPLSAAPATGTVRLRVQADRVTSYSLDIYRNSAVVAVDTAEPVAIDGTRLGEGFGRLAGLGQSSPTVGTRQTIYSANMSTDPGWAYTGAWAYGQPTGLGGDPAAGFTGPNVVGYNLAGQYANNIAAPITVTTPAIDVAGYTSLSLVFRRWLGIESSTYDHARILASPDGQQWTTVWQNSTTTINEQSWTRQTVDLASVAADWSNLYLRWELGPTDFTVTYAGWNLDDVEVSGIALVADVDEYSFTVAETGRPLDVIVAAQGGMDFSHERLELVGPNGTVVASNQPGTSATNYDLAILGYVPLETGTYRARLVSRVAGQYAVVITEGTSFETEANDNPGQPARSLDGINQAIGLVGQPPVAGTYTFTIAPGTTMNLAGTVTMPDGSASVPFEVQAPGSLTAALAGSFTVALADQSIRIQNGTIDLVANPGSFRPGFFAADFAARVGLPVSPGVIFDAYAVIRDLAGRFFSEALTLDDAGHFDAGGVGFKFTVGGIDFELLGQSGDFPAATPETGNQPSDPGRIEIGDGVARLILPFRLLFDVPIPITGMVVQMAFTSQIVATASIPRIDEDHYTQTLIAGQTIEISTETLLDDSIGSLNSLDPRLTIYGPGGAPVAVDDNGGGDGKNALVRFTATESGVYRFVVAAAAGVGEYRLLVHDVPTAQIDGPTAGVRGQPLSFTLGSELPGAGAEADDFTYSIDWESDGQIDQVVQGPSLLAIQHIFPSAGQYTVTVWTESDEVTSDPATHIVQITPFALAPNPLDPSRMDLVWGGTDADEMILLFPLPDSTSVLVLSGTYSGPLDAVAAYGGFVLRALGGITGDVVVYAQGGDDLVWAEFLGTKSVRLFGGMGNDVLIGGAGSDLLDGGEGDDVLLGHAGDDELLGGPGSDFLIGGTGADRLRGGAGQDLVLAGPTLFDANSTAILAARAEWTSERPLGERVANLSGTGTGPRANGEYFLSPAEMVERDDQIDQVFGDEDEDWLFLDPSLDIAHELEPGDIVTEVT